MVRAMGEYFTEWARKYMPDPWLFAILLTFLTYILGLIFTKSGPFDMILHWYKGFWELLAFAMQMCLVLVTGYSLATAPAVMRALDSLARILQRRRHVHGRSGGSHCRLYQLGPGAHCGSRAGQGSGAPGNLEEDPPPLPPNRGGRVYRTSHLARRIFRFRTPTGGHQGSFPGKGDRDYSRRPNAL